MSKTLHVMGYDVFVDDLDSVNLKDEKKIINTINPHSYVVAKNDAAFQKALNTSSLLLPDGSGIVLAASVLHRKKINKIAGADLHQYLLEKLNTQNGKCFYMGSSRSTLGKIKIKLESEYPNISADYYSPPFKPQFTVEENSHIIEAINSFKPDVLFVGMTAPKQEKWVYEHKKKLDAKVICSIGAVFDFYAGNIKRSSPSCIKLHCEWLPRLLKEPRRLWKRNFVSTPLFLIDLAKHKLN